MRATYDPEADAAYFYLGEATVAATEEVMDNVMLDLDAEGRIVGMEVLHASRKLAPGAWRQAETRLQAAE